jgi:DNA-binding NtrC family response regulator
MKIIIIESELYLAQSIAAKLSEHNFETEIYSSIKDAMHSDGDTYLLSTSISGQSCMPIVQKFKEKVIILMVNYINNDTVGEPMRNGAHDYIVKPFMIEDLMRKIEHHRIVCMLERSNAFFEDYTNDLLEQIDHGHSVEKFTLPVILQTNYQRAADKLALDVSHHHELPLVYISLESSGWQTKVRKLTVQAIGYITHLEKLKKGEKEELFTLLNGKEFILTTTTEIDAAPFEILTVSTKNKLYDQNEILTIDEYVQHVVKSFQYKLPDTELSKKLGISRKSLWEKRKKYDLFKKK